jgi:DNA topoisomerase-1
MTAPGATSQRQAKAIVTGAVKEVAAVIGNTPAVCRASYIHPAIIEAYHAGTLPAPGEELRAPAGLRPLEGLLLAFLEGGGAHARRAA